MDGDTKSTAGMTIIEVIVGVAILLLIIGSAVAGLSAYSDRQVFNQYVQDVRLSVKEQRQRTVASVDNTEYGVYVGTSTFLYFQGNTYPVPVASTTVQEFPNTITATSSFSDANWFVTFTRLTGAASATGTITLMDAKTGRQATITINSLGLIE